MSSGVTRWCPLSDISDRGSYPQVHGFQGVWWTLHGVHKLVYECAFIIASECPWSWINVKSSWLSWKERWSRGGWRCPFSSVSKVIQLRPPEPAWLVPGPLPTWGGHIPATPVVLLLMINTVHFSFREIRASFLALLAFKNGCFYCIFFFIKWESEMTVSLRKLRVFRSPALSADQWLQFVCKDFSL